MTDDVGYEGFGCYGSKTYQTPHIDALAGSGIRFDHCYSSPLCTPSRMQLMTGKYNFRNYTEFGTLPPAERTFGHLFQEAGYKTCAAGKWQLVGHYEGSNYRGDGTYPSEAGFDDYCLWQVDQLGSRYWNPVINRNGSDVENTEGKYGPDIICDHINQFIEEQAGQPFFVYYPMILPHSPFHPAPSSRPSSEERFTNDRKHFKEMVEYVDEIVGRIVRNLDTLGLRENTLILFTSDNGTARGITSTIGDQTIVGAKGIPTLAGTHVPLIANWKGRIPEGKACDDLIDFTDFLPTLLEAAGEEVPSDFTSDGRSFCPQLLGKKGEPRDWVFCHYDPRWGNRPKSRYVHDKTWKLYDDGRIFNLETDPLEERPLSREQLGDSAQALIDNFEGVLLRMK
jgi:arylsulfatase A-like enzyme